ncbi:MAG: hypothetical protein NZ872_01710 [Archaeoglobaceae archaeon]|nr:hypothetical protein [Archaeoglobaceae archaeon]MDW8127915.1 hypothetical protein [Archaeoglobaceae archaeon]
MSLLLLIFLILLLIIIPGFFIWLALALLGKKRSIFKCGLANLVSLVASVVITSILSLIPLLAMISPLIFALIYLWVFKEILDLGWIYAILVVLISIACVMLLSIVFIILFSAFFKPPWIPGFGF